MRTAFVPFARCLVACAVLAVQSPAAAQFHPAQYAAFLEDTAGLGASELIQSRAPFGPYLFEVDPREGDPEYLDHITTALELTDEELGLIERHGFMASERLAGFSYGYILSRLWHDDIPLFLTSDVLLHAVHRSYVVILATIERSYMRHELDKLLNRARARWLVLDEAYGEDPDLRVALDDVDIYLAVALSLLKGRTLLSLGTNDDQIQALVQLARQEQPATIQLLGTPRDYDFSQLTVRGHYAQHPDLHGYFRAMVWMGRTEFRLTEPQGVLELEIDLPREIRAAFTLREVCNGPGIRENWGHLDEIIEMMVGTQDNTTFPDMDRLWSDAGLTSLADIAPDDFLGRIRVLIEDGDYQPQAIHSQILAADPRSPEPIQPGHAFLLLGQRFIPDSYIMANVVYDRTRKFRGLPSPLDVLYCLGNDDVLPLLRDDLELYDYAENLAALRFLMDSYDPEYWSRNLYVSWVRAIASLGQTGRQPGVPEFMRTGAWQQQKMNTQLASWAELRHDTLLYAKQSYTGGAVCSYPRVYVEPIPEFYAALRQFAVLAADRFGSLPWESGARTHVVEHFEHMTEVMSKLEVIAQKELDGTPLTDGEVQFLEGVFFESGCARDPDGWLTALYFDRDVDDLWDRIVADVHTQPTDEFGIPVGHVLHVATGDPLIAVFLAARPGEPLTAYAGPVASYHEVVTQNFQRLTDEEWEAAYTVASAERADWTYVYVADIDGRVRSGGRRLVESATHVADPESPTPERPGQVAWLHNYPNPFNPQTTIAFRVEGHLSLEARLEILDSRGRFVRSFAQGPLTTNTYFVKWDGTDHAGRPAASGVYHVRLVGGPRALSHKVTLLR